MTNSSQSPTPRVSRGIRKKRSSTVEPASQRGRLLLAAGLGLALLLAAVFLLNRPTADIEGVRSFSGVPQGHQDGPLTYPQQPPVGGIHNAAWQNCGIYDEPVPNERAVHSMEHGAVWITYDLDLSGEEVEQLRKLARGRGHVLLTPYQGQPSPIMATAWGLQLQAESAADARLPRFVAAYTQGPQTLEPGAPCSGAVGEPVER